LEDLVAITDAEIKKIKDAVWDHTEPNPYDDGKTTRRMGGDMRLMEFRADARNQALLSILASIASRVDVDPAEIQAIKDALAVPTAQANAEAVLEALGGVPMDTLAQTLKNVLSESQLQELAQLLQS
jgi:hypothetical protein